MGTKNMAAEMNTVVEGSLKYREGKKWKPRYCVIKKPSPVADRLLVLLYKEQKDVSHKDNQPKTTFVVEDYYGIEADLNVDKENYVMALICQKSVSVFAFDYREGMLHFEISIRRSLGQGSYHQYPVRLCKVPTHSKLPLGPAHLHIHGQKFCLTTNNPPKLLLSWNITELRRFGPVEGRFMFEGGSRCGKGSGVHGFESNQAEEINRNFHGSGSGRAPSKRPHMWRKYKPTEQPASNGDQLQDTNYLQPNLDNSARMDERMRSKRHSVGVVDYREAAELVEKKRLMSIENVDKERLTRIYDIPPQLVRKVDSNPSIPETEAEQIKSIDSLADPPSKSTSNLSSPNSEKNRSNRSLDGGNRSSRNSGDGSRSNRNSSEGSRSNRNSGDGSRSNRNSGDGTRSNRQSGDGKRSKRNSSDGNRSNRNSSDSSQSSRNSGDGSKYRARRYSGENGHSLWHPDFAHRSSMALRQSLENILAGNQNSVEDLNSEFKENSLSRNNLYKSTGEINIDKAVSDIVLKDKLTIQPRCHSISNLLSTEEPQLKLCEGNHELEKLTQEEERLQREIDLLDNMEKMLEVCLDEDSQSTNISQMPKGFADVLSTLTIDTNCSEDDSDQKTPLGCNDKREAIQADRSMLSPNLTAKIKRIPSCSKLVAPLPYVNLEEYDIGSPASDHVDVSHVPLVRRGFSYDNLTSVTKDSMYGQGNLRTKSFSCSETSDDSSGAFTWRPPPPLPPKNVKEESPPPELPPKGPNLLRRQKGTSGLLSVLTDSAESRGKLIKAASFPSAQIIEATRQYHSPRPVPTRVPKPICSEPEEPYMMMGDILPKAVSRRPSLTCTPVVELSEEDDPKCGYLDMSAVFDAPPPLLPKSSSGPEILQMTKTPQKVLRSQSARAGPEDGRRPRLLHSQSAEPCLESQDNYIEMSLCETGASHLKGQKKLDESLSRMKITDSDVKAALPFPDLITVQSYRSDKKLEMSSTSDTVNNDEASLNASGGGDKLDASSGSSKSLGFFSRFIQRTKLKERKSSLSSSESVAEGQKSDPVLSKTKTDTVLSSSVVTCRSGSVACQAKLDLLAPPPDRQRSSSFPNASVFLENSQGGDNSRVNGNKRNSGQMDKRGSQSEDTLLALMAKENEQNKSGPFSPYWCMNPLEISCTSSCTSSRTEVMDNINNNPGSRETIITTQSGESNVGGTSHSNTVSVSEESPSQQSDVMSRHLLTSPSPEPNEVSTTVIHSQPSEDFVLCSDSPLHRTDDEKLLALEKASKQDSGDGKDVRVASEGKMTASEQAAAIAEYVTALAPFVPPKTKLHYPGGLSPVIEGLASPPTDSQNAAVLVSSCPASTGRELTHGHPGMELSKERLTSAAWSKRRAKETLRILPAEEDENGNIWIRRGHGKRTEPVNGHGAAGEDGMNTASRRNDALNEVKEHLDGLSLSSHGSSAGSPGVRAEDTPLRRSPASTTLRPRSGKEYHRIDRRRLTDDHSQSSSPLTPQSPSTASIFTFDTPSSPSVRSVLSRDESPTSSPSYRRGQYPCHSYVNLGKGADNRPNLYVNVDMTPPSSPFRRTHMPLEQIDPQLNYAEIDLSQAGSDRSRKPKKGVQKAATIEYAKIDMLATAAVSKTRKEQAQSREDSLRRSGRKFSAPASVIVKEHRALGTGSFRDKERPRKLSTSSVDSNG